MSEENSKQNTEATSKQNHTVKGSADKRAVSPQKTKKNKGGGIIRWAAILPLTVFIVAVGVFFHFFFDPILKKSIESVGYSALGSEVNISSLKTSFLKGSIHLTKLELTDSANPDYNSIEISKLAFDMNMDALLRFKFVVENMATEGIQFQSKRRHRGKVAPPKPPSESEGPSFVEELQVKALTQLENDQEENFVSNIARFLQTGDEQAELKNLENLLGSKKLAEDLNQKWGSKKEEWDSKVKSLPQKKDLDDYKKRFEAIKYKDFKTPQELKESVDQFNALKKDIDNQKEQIKSVKTDLVSDVKSIETDYKAIDQQIKTDIDTVKTKFQIPKIDAAEFSKSLFTGYLTPYIYKLDHYKNLTKKYLPPKYAGMIDGKQNSKATEQEPAPIQPLPREKGVVYEFPVKGGYPLVWIQKILVSSTSNAQVDYGDISGSIENITTNQKQINKPTTMNIKGDFKSKNVYGLKIDGLFNNLKSEPEVGIDFKVGSYNLSDLALIKSKDASISIPSSNNALSIKAATVGFKNYNIAFENVFQKVQFVTEAKDKTVNEILNHVLTPIHDFNIKASLSGSLSSLNSSLRSDLGQKLEDGFKNLLKVKVDEVNQKIRVEIDKAVAKQKEDLNLKVAALSKGHINDITSSENALDQIKNMADERMKQAQKDMENKAKKEVEKQKDKAVKDLKKKLGF